jgi:uncharacterized damage-inducible protein DinB
MQAGHTNDKLIADLLAAWRINEKMNQFLIDQLSEEAWTAKPPGGKGRTIAAIFAHIHDVRHMWMQTVAKDLPGFVKASREDFTRHEARKVLGESAAAMGTVLERGFSSGRISGFPPSAAAFFGYMMTHDAHHRGQVVMLARQAGHPVAAQAAFGLWDWGKRFKELQGGEETA